ncbi:hypothetical protein [Pseudomonas sp. UMAB-40]|uniref:hypothetical protein n=1 Tax=Pseudomonas sp. UMAB-40 TaxID=1365407 RepID=UPI00214B89F2|nr:hypothetical protein [Pseudomonas sp. UMAB-40]
MTKRWISEEHLKSLPADMTRRALGGAASTAAPRKAPSKAAGRSAQVPPPVVAEKPAPTAKQRMQAKGRLPKGVMNATETKYAAHLDELKLAGDVLWWRFEPVKLLLAPLTTLTPDFMLMLADGAIELHDVKGAKAIYEDDAKVKMKVAAKDYPFVFRVVFPKAKKDGGGWLIEVVGG